MPDYIKVDDSVSKALGKPKRKIVTLIKTGVLKGKQYGERDTRIEASELPSSFFVNNPELKPQVETKPETLAEETATEPKKEKTTTSSVPPILQAELDGVKLAEAKMKRIEAEIKLAEVEGKRDLPEKIAKLEESINQRGIASKQREEAVTLRETALSQREQAIKVSEANIISQASGVERYVQTKTAEANKVRADADAYDTNKRAEADTYYNTKVADANTLDTGIQTKVVEIDELNAEVTEKIQSLVGEIKKWGGIADREATKSYRQAEHSSGKVEAYHIRRSNSLWGLKDSLNKILKAIGG